eukprot:TRINITY_DN29230_c0_g1_i1.p1 TRINITY_DN29230_c0_g1~~TRINITY_DN29230_c0_g1_i1.p1  ORF type:complete len:589 (-),score=82.61 TRINITY_DN29230_c0_g1_i1:127-1845(-)
MGVLRFLEENIVTTLPKTIYIENLPLGILFLTLRLGSLAVCLWGIYSTNGWTDQVIPMNTLSIWSEQSPSYEQEQVADLQKDFCSQSSNYDYQYDDVGKFRFQNISCYDIDDNERWIKGESEIFFPSFFQENMTTIKSGGTAAACPAACGALAGCLSEGGFWFTGKKNDQGECLCKCNEGRNRFITGLAQNTISFEHAVTAEEPWSIKSHTASSTIPAESLKTVVTGPGGKELVFQPGDIVSLTLEQLFDMAEEQVSLTDPFTGTNPNRISRSDVKRFPAVRMTGMAVEVTATYYNILDHRYPKAHRDRDSRCKGKELCPICVVAIKARKLWTSSPRTDYAQPIDASRGTGSYRYRYMYGIRIHFSATGSFSFRDPSKLFAIIAAVVVYIQLPRTLITFLAQYLLGTLSVIYMNATCEPITLKSMFRGILTRALLAKRIYRLWYGTPASDQANAEEGIMLRATAAVAEADNKLLKQELSDLLEEVGLKDRIDDYELESMKLLLSMSDRMSEPDFIRNVIHGQYASLDDVVKMYDVDRKHRCLERCFDSEVFTRRALHSEAKKRAKVAPASVD